MHDQFPVHNEFPVRNQLPARHEFTVTTGEEALQVMVRILTRYDVGRLALHGPDYPYVIPMNHHYLEGKLLLHGSYAGRKIDLLAADPRACYEVDGPKDGVAAGTRSCHLEYESVLCYGRIRIVDDLKLKADYLARLQASFDRPPLKHGEVARCNAFVFEIEEMTGRTGRFRPAGERPLYVYRFDRADRDQRRAAEAKAEED